MRSQGEDTICEPRRGWKDLVLQHLDLGLESWVWDIECLLLKPSSSGALLQLLCPLK
jgi:hypothetical protein